jgi:hypothetical protein
MWTHIPEVRMRSESVNCSTKIDLNDVLETIGGKAIFADLIDVEATFPQPAHAQFHVDASFYNTSNVSTSAEVEHMKVGVSKDNGRASGMANVLHPASVWMLR